MKRKKPSISSLSRGFRRGLAAVGIVIDALGRARKDGRFVARSRVVRAVRSVAAKAKPPAKPAKRPSTRRPTAIAKRRESANTHARPAHPAKRPERKRPAPKKPVAVAKRPERKRPYAAPTPPPKAKSKPALAKRPPPPPPPKKPARPKAPPKAKKPSAALARAKAQAERLRKELAVEKKRGRAEQKRLEERMRAMERSLEAIATERRAPALPAPPPEVPSPPTRPPTAEEILEAEEAAEERAKQAAEGAKAPPTPADLFALLIEDVARRGRMPTKEEMDELRVAAAALAAPPVRPRIEATDADYTVANSYPNLTVQQQMDWARTGRITDAAKALIRERAIEQAIANRKLDDIVAIRKSLVFQDDPAIRKMQRLLGPIDGREVLSKEDTRRALDEYLLSRPAYLPARQEIEAYLASLRPTYEQIQRAVDAGEDPDDVIAALAKRHPELDVRELWSMYKSPKAIGVKV